MVVSPSTITTSTCYPFAGIDSNLVAGLGQTAALGYLGSTAPPSNTQFIRVGRKVDTEPVVAGNKPIVDFYCQIGLTKSTNSRNDDFELLVYNWDDKVLGGLTFDMTQGKLFRYDANEYNTGSSDSPYTDTGLSLSSLYGTVLEVTMHVNYKTNTWSATMGGVQVVSGAQFTRRPTTGTSSAARTFGSVQARWYITTVGYPGNNWMLFNDWSISASAEPSIPASASAGYAANSTASITVTDADSVGWTVSSDQTWAVVSPTTGTGTGTVTVTCAANSGLARTATITIGGQTSVVTQAAAPYALWAASLPSDRQGFSQDADNDGVANGVEYAMGRTAASATGDNGPAQLPSLVWTGSGASRRPALAINLATPSPVDTIYDVEVSNTLSGKWTTIMEKIGNNAWTVVGASGATVASASASQGRMLHTVTDTQSHHFMRMKITKTP